MTVTLITGANKGLGYETARQLLLAGHTVYVGSRDAEKGAEAAERLGDGARPIHLDVTDDEAVAAAAAALAEDEGHLDVLVNNAGISGDWLQVADTTAADVARVFDTNFFGAVRVTQAMIPLLQRSDAPVIVNVSSGLGSVGMAADPEREWSGLVSIPYTTSKSALNMLSVQYAKAYPAMRVNVVDPGYTATDLNYNLGTQTAEEGAAVIVRMACIGPDGPSATYVGNEGPLPW